MQKIQKLSIRLVQSVATRFVVYTPFTRSSKRPANFH